MVLKSLKRLLNDVTLKGSSMMELKFNSDGIIKRSTMTLKSLKRFLDDGTKNVPKWWY